VVAMILSQGMTQAAVGALGGAGGAAAAGTGSAMGAVGAAGGQYPDDRRPGSGGPGMIGPSAGMAAILKAIENLMTNRYKDHEQPDKPNCELFPYKDRKTKCSGKGQASHHVIPDHCWRPGSGIQKLIPSDRMGAEIDDMLTHDNYYYQNMNKAEGLSICVDGGGKTGTHGVIHGLFDPAEAAIGKIGKPPFTGKLGDLEDAAAKAVSLATGCPEASIKTQLREYHNTKALDEGKMLRADPFGKNTTSLTDYNVDPVIRYNTTPGRSGL